MPELDPLDIQWDDDNLEHATGHGISADEIDQVIINRPSYRKNKNGRSGDYLAFGVTDGGRRVVAVVRWIADERLVPPITAWDEIPARGKGRKQMPKRPEEMTEAELAEYYYQNRHDLAGAEVPSRTPVKMGVMISVRFTPDEARQVRAAAAQANMSVSAYLRQCAFAAPHDNVVDLDRVRADLRDVRSRAADALRALADSAAVE